MAYYDDILKSEEEQKKALLRQKLAEKLQGTATLRRDLTQQQEQELPRFQQERNQADADQYMAEQRLNERMAATGNYRSGTMRTALGNLMAGRNNALTESRNREGVYRQGMANRLSDLAGQEQQANDEYSTGLNLLGSEIAAQRAKMLMDAQQRRGSGGGGYSGGGGSTQDAINQLQEFYNSGGSYASLLDQFNANQKQMRQDGVDINAVRDAMERLYMGQTSAERKAWESDLNTEANQAGLGYMDKYDRAARLTRGAYDQGVNLDEAQKRYERMMYGY